jgi:carboxyl-terminal processing protease
MIVLVNKGSASASEIVAAALQDAGRAKILGETTFGKGTFQRIYTFNDGSSLKMTIGEWRSPNGKKIDKIGVVPDISMPSTNASRDEMLLRAIDLLR